MRGENEREKGNFFRLVVEENGEERKVGRNRTWDPRFFFSLHNWREDWKENYNFQFCPPFAAFTTEQKPMNSC